MNLRYMFGEICSTIGLLLIIPQVLYFADNKLITREMFHIFMVASPWFITIGLLLRINSSKSSEDKKIKRSDG